MAELFMLFVATMLVNNFVLVQFLGLCPFMGVSNRLDTSLSMALATTFVLTFSATLSHIIYHTLLLPMHLEYLQIITFIVVIASLVQAAEFLMRALSPLMYQVLGIYLPLITTNCAVLGVALLSVREFSSLLETIVFAIAASLGFSLVLILFSAIRERLSASNIPEAFAGTPIHLITAGLMSMAFMGFAGLS
ncbi:MAG: electron transport complex subunit RsxA [Pseudomonadales bacterium]|nr:electron transport complex subunit RsxA [Pseudomonadales bacterium]